MNGRKRDRPAPGGKTDPTVPRQFVKQVTAHVGHDADRSERQHIIARAAAVRGREGRFRASINFLVQWH